jgi:hypothetical protein
MTGRFRWITPLALLIAISAVLPPQADASVDCTDAYMTCLNDSWDKKGFAELLANLECGARYARCIKDILTAVR